MSPYTFLIKNAPKRNNVSLYQRALCFKSVQQKGVSRCQHHICVRNNTCRRITWQGLGIPQLGSFLVVFVLPIQKRIQSFHKLYFTKNAFIQNPQAFSTKLVFTLHSTQMSVYSNSQRIAGLSSIQTAFIPIRSISAVVW